MEKEVKAPPGIEPGHTDCQSGAEEAKQALGLHLVDEGGAG